MEGFEREQLFDEDYLYFYETLLADEVSDRQTDAVWRLLELEPGMEVLDLACGHGRIANRLAERGVRVTALDATPLFLDLARQDAARRGVEVEYVEGDMRSLPWRARFDAVVNWFTSFGYFDDDTNRSVLAQAYLVLKPGGRLGIENNNLAFIVRNFRPDIVWERDGDFMLDRNALDLDSGRAETERIVLRAGRVRRFRFAVRMLTFPELQGWLLDAGFTRVEGYGRDGEELTLESSRMITVARR